MVTGLIPRPPEDGNWSRHYILEVAKSIPLIASYLVHWLQYDMWWCGLDGM